jgi:3-mercaptopropionate dioxygenase
VTTPPTTPARAGTALDALVAELDAAIRGSGGVQPLVEAALGDVLGHRGLLTPEQSEPDPAGYRRHVLHVAPDGAWSLVAVARLPGQTTPVHNHVAWSVVGVHQGVEFETRYRAERGELVVEAELVNPVGVVPRLPPGDVHRVAGASEGVTVSLQVFGVDVRLRGTSIRRRYDLPVR